jgi:hypothetical protein
MTIGQFNKSKPAANAKAPPKPRSRWAGVKAAQPRDSFPHAGTYRFRVVSCEEGFNPGTNNASFKAHLEIVAQADGQTMHADGDTVLALFMLSTAAGQSRAKSFVIAASGHEDEASYDEFDPDGEFIDAVLGHANARSADAASFAGRLVDCRVSKGKDTGDGDYYREYEWSVVEVQDA